jgi:hypothetical protein
MRAERKRTLAFYNQVTQDVLIEPQALRETLQISRIHLEAKTETVAVVMSGERVTQTLLRGNRLFFDFSSDLFDLARNPICDVL